MRRRFPVPFRNCRLLAITLPPPFYTIPADCVTSARPWVRAIAYGEIRLIWGSVSFTKVVWLSSPGPWVLWQQLWPAGCVPSTPSPASPAAATPDCAAPSATSSDAPPARRQMAQPFGQRFLAPVTRHPIRQAHNPPRPFPTFRQTARVQQPPRRRKPRYPNVPPILPQQVKHALLARRLPAINQLKHRRNVPIPIAGQMLRTLRP